MDIKQVAEQLIAELENGAVRQRMHAEGVALFYNRMVEVSEKEKAEKAPKEDADKSETV